MARTVYATVAATSPKLTLYFDGDASNAVPARSLVTVAAGNRVRVEVQPHGQLPIVQGVVTNG